MTSQRHPRTVFRRALQHGNLLVAEATAREVGKMDRESLELTALVAKADRVRRRRMAARWVQRLPATVTASSIIGAAVTASHASPHSEGRPT